MDSLLDVILRESNMRDAIKAVERNNGAPGVDGMTVNELDEWWHKNGEDFRQKVYHNQYKPSPVKRIYIPKPNGKRRPTSRDSNRHRPHTPAGNSPDSGLNL